MQLSSINLLATGRSMRARHSYALVLLTLAWTCCSIHGDELARVDAHGSVDDGRQVPPLHHPDYPDLPLDLARDYAFGVPINLSFPGLQLVHVSPSGAPLFIINDFLNTTECELLVAKLSHSEERIASVAYDQNSDAKADNLTARTSTHVRVAKAETINFHKRVAALTLRKIANMESTKIIHYQQDQEFTRHFDFSATSGRKSRFKALDGRDIPKHVNRELTLFVFLNDVAEGGETAFYDASTSGGWQSAPEYLRVRPERGLAVLFYATVQPPDSIVPVRFPPAASSFGARDGFRVDPFSLHAGLPAVEDKYLLVQWIWPRWLNHDISDLDNIYHTETKACDGVVG